jgi:5-methyltetrahydrofolate--homocysteine methyltransferase
VDAIADSVIGGDQERVTELVGQALAEGLDPQAILEGGLTAAMQVVGDEFAKGELFIPEMLLAARAMQQGVDLLAPYLVDTPQDTKGTAVIGTVQGDLHDIGKNLVGVMLKGVGLKVVDLGTNVSPDAFAEAVRTHRPHIVGLSALLTTTMVNMEVVIDALREAGIRDQVEVMVGGAPVTQVFAEEIGADAYADDAGAAAQMALRLIHERRPKVPRPEPGAELRAPGLAEPSGAKPAIHVEDLAPDLALPHKDRVHDAMHLQEGPVPWVEIVVDEVVMAKVLGQVPRDWMPESEAETKLGLSWEEKVDFARHVGLSALGIFHWENLGSHQTGEFQVVARKSMIKSRADLGRLRVPRLTASDLYPEVEKALTAIGDTGIALFVEFAFCFDPAISDLGFENFCYQINDDPGFVVEVFKRYEEYIGNLIDIYSGMPEIDFIWVYQLKRDIGDRVCLNGNLDVDLIARGTRQQVVDETWRLLTHLNKGGGYMFSSGNAVSYFANVDNVLAVADAIRRFNADRYG